MRKKDCTGLKNALRDRLGIRTLSRRWIRLIALVIVGFATTFSLPAFSTQPATEIPPAITQSSTAQSFWRQGLDHYQASQFQRAIAPWEQAIQGFENQGDILHQASVLNNLSLAYQHLGQFDQAEEAIASSLQLLGNSQKTSYIEVRAKVFNTEGSLFWSKGELENALESWEKSAQYYAQIGQENGFIGSQVNQAKALQALGLSLQSEEKFKSISKQLEVQSDPYLQATGWLNFGKTLRQIGKLQTFECYQELPQTGELEKTQCDGSLEVLEKSLKVANKLRNSSLKYSILLELGNTHRSLADKTKIINEKQAKENAQIDAQTTLEFYQKASKSPNVTQQLQAQLNGLSFLIDAKKYSLLDNEEYSQVTQIISSIETEIDSLQPGRNSVYAQLNYAQSLMKLLEQERVFTQESTLYQNLPNSNEIAEFLADVVQQARFLKDAKAESYALGQLGHLYKQSQQWSEAQYFTEEAILSIESIQAPHLKYLWEWQLGRLITKQGEGEGKISPEARQAAITAYQRSIDALKSVRQDLLYVDRDIQFSFRDDVEPIYREFIDLLLRSPEGEEPSQENLKRAIGEIDALQLAEIENFVGCELATFKVDQDLDGLDPKAVFIYPIILKDRIGIILDFPKPTVSEAEQKLDYRETLINKEEVEKTLRSLRFNLTVPGNTPEVIKYAQKLYQWLFKPLKADLERNPQIKTLVFVLDGDLRNIPMGVLYDGERYLIEQDYAIAVAPRLQLFSPSPSKQRLNVFTGGVDIRQTIENIPFPEIEKLIEELERIAETTSSSHPLVNEDFTKTNIEQQLEASQFSGIHWKTHGVFSSDPERTFIVAYQESIKARDLDILIQTGSQKGFEPIELLVLSACETAQGDNRAVLGLAGIAVRTGARSTLSTLWRADDSANTELMARFYQELSQGETKAEALHQAQLMLMNEYGAEDPYTWATYILVGNWL